ncbi:MAG: reverse gyrase [Desulfurococcales archaeon]|nr:reverse gyrase [Desulfurococcales archaeon]
MSGVTALYRGLCPNCKGPITHDRLEAGLPCSRCLSGEVDASNPIEVENLLLKSGKLLGYLWISSLEKDFSEFKEYFRRKLGYNLWSAQGSWAKRLLQMDNLAIIAPTGVGKTTLLMVYTAYRVERHGWRVLYLAPTENIVRQVASRLTSLLGSDKIAYYYSSMGRKLKEDMLKAVYDGDFKVLVVTTGFLQKRFNDLARFSPFNLVIVDDVDSILRNSRNIDRVLLLMGISEDVIRVAYMLVNAKLKLYNAISTGNNARIEELQRKIAELTNELRGKQYPLTSQLVIASATGRPRGVKHLIFKELLGFEVGGATDYMRNVVDSYLITEEPVQAIIDIVRRLGKGGIVFVSQSYGKSVAKLLVEKLKIAGISVTQALTSSRRAIEALSQGKVDVIVGVASRYGVIVRGIDLPEAVRYAIFVGVPSRKINAYEALFNVRRLIRVLMYLSSKGDEVADNYLRRLKEVLDKISDPMLITLAARGKIKAEGLLAEAAGLVNTALSYAVSKIASIVGEADRKILRIGGIVFTLEDNLYMYIPDAPTYLQASGRTSRLLRGKMTLGLSIIIEKHKELVDALEERLSWYTTSKLLEYGKLDLGKIIEEINESRGSGGKSVSVETLLLLVESPTKAKTIAWFWGKPSKRRLGHLTIYETSAVDVDNGRVYILNITSTKGHMFDLALDEEGSEHGVIVINNKYIPVYDTIKKCMNCGYTFSASPPCPRCGSPNILDSKSRINAIRKLAMEVDKVVIATDPDREGEKIAWDIYIALKPYNRNIVRARFHEVTKETVLKSLKTAGPIDKMQVYAQIVRRIEDRWIGFSLSRILWDTFNKKWLGAGRVQTPVLGWIVDRYNEWKSNRGYLVVLTLENNGYISIFVDDKDEVDTLKNLEYVTVSNASYTVKTVNPPPPYTTDSLIYDASLKLKYSASLTMKLAQDLFESGLITYHRTDSTRISTAGLGIAKAYLDSKGMLEYYIPRKWGDGGAHEAIRPTKPLDTTAIEEKILEGSLKVPIKLYRAHYRLYDLIFRRFIASQMREAQVREVHATFVLGDERVVDKHMITRVISDGFNTVYGLKIEEWADNLNTGYKIRVVDAQVYRSSRIRLFKSGDIVRLMKEKGIGRPSTYVKAVESNRRHGYIVESRKAKYLIPTKLGINVYNLLVENYKSLVTEETSRRMEELLDKIERGLIDPAKSLDLVYNNIFKMTGMGYVGHRTMEGTVPN